MRLAAIEDKLARLTVTEEEMAADHITDGTKPLRGKTSWRGAAEGGSCLGG
jgi:hypothetical protein